MVKKRIKFIIIIYSKEKNFDIYIKSKKFEHRISIVLQKIL